MSPFHGLILIDGSSYLYRAFHALPPLTNSHGEPTGAVLGVVNMLNRLLHTYQPTQIAVVFDAKGKTFRDDLYEQYKSHRPSMPDELRRQIEPLHHVVRALGFPLLMIDGVEADDVIGTLAKQASEQQLPVLISTGDKDLAQLVNKHVTLTNTMTNSQLDEAGVKEKFGVTPEQMIDYLSLVGDSSDNIPGVPSVGPKTAKWLAEYHSLDNLIANADKISGKVGEKFRDFIPHLPLTKQLVTIHCDVPLACRPNDLLLQAPNEEALRELYTKLEFKNLLKQLGGDDTAEPPKETAIKHSTITDKSFETILTEDAWHALLKQLQSAQVFACDTETSGLDFTTAELVGMSFALDGKKGYYLPFVHNYLGAPEQLNREKCLAALKPILADQSISKIFQHAKFDMNMLANYDVVVNNIFDTQIASYVLQSNDRHDLDTLALKYLGHKNITFESIAGKGVKQLTFNQIDLDIAGPYAAEDALVTFQLYEIFSARLRNEPKLLALLENIELPLVPILSAMEYYGVLIDGALLKQQSYALEKRLLKLQEEAYQLAGQAFNLNSPKQLQEILFGKLNLPVTQKTPTGQPSTAEDVLQDLSYEYELPRVILEYRSLSKLKSTYTDRLPEQIAGRTGRIHTSYHQAVVPTGRLSSSDPNLQNIPVRREEGQASRKAFIAPEGCKILSADYSQVELRIMAHLSQDERLLAAFKANEDVHRATASEVFDTPLEKVTSEERRNAKAINFGLMYGMSACGLAKQLSVSREAAQHYIDNYFLRYPKVKDYMNRTRAQAHEQGFVETVEGRRLYLPEINSRQAMRVKASERAAINAPLQGTAADIIKKAMILVSEWLHNEGKGIRLVMQVHDELVFEVPDAMVDLASLKIPALMSEAAALSIPLLVEVGCADNWADAH